MYKNKTFKAIVLAGGSGSRLNPQAKKQYLEINRKPMLVYALEAFEKSAVDEIILVAPQDEEELCREKIVRKYNLSKVKTIIAGGRERYHSTARGLAAAVACDYILIHDAARPCLTEDVILRCMDKVLETGACTAAVATVDTINLVGPEGKVQETLDRNQLWSIQTPQAFKYDVITRAHRILREEEPQLTRQERNAITDDVSVAKIYAGADVYVVEGSRMNIKVTTPFDLEIAGIFLKR